MATYQFQPRGYRSVAFRGATAECQNCGHRWEMQQDNRGVITFHDCPDCQAETVIKVVEFGPESEHAPSDGYPGGPPITPRRR